MVTSLHIFNERTTVMYDIPLHFERIISKLFVCVTFSKIVCYAILLVVRNFSICGDYCTRVNEMKELKCPSREMINNFPFKEIWHLFGEINDNDIQLLAFSITGTSRVLCLIVNPIIFLSKLRSNAFHS